MVALQPGPWEMTDLRYHSELTRWASAEVAAPLRAQHTELVRAVQCLLFALAEAGKGVPPSRSRPTVGRLPSTWGPGRRLGATDS
eukprot:COSAG01_NODE_122_length_25212_cov_25.945646_2_plen_85_part_00